DNVDRHPDELIRTEQRTGGRQVAAGRQVDAIGAASLGERRIAMHHETRAMASRHRHEHAGERDLLVLRQILLAQAHPAAAGRERRAHHLAERPPRLPAVRHKKERRIGKLHVPTRPNCGLEGSAWASFGIRPASRAIRPASTAARMLFAISTGSRAFDTAVLSSTAEQPSSIASAASEAVPTPASSTTGT